LGDGCRCPAAHTSAPPARAPERRPARAQAFARGGRTSFYSAALGGAAAAPVELAPAQKPPGALCADGSLAKPGAGAGPPGACASPSGGAPAAAGPPALLPSRLALELRRLARGSAASAAAGAASDEEMAGSERGSDEGPGCKTRPASPGAASVGAGSERSDADVVALGAQLVLEAGLASSGSFADCERPLAHGAARRLRGALARSVADVLALYDAVRAGGAAECTSSETHLRCLFLVRFFYALSKTRSWMMCVKACSCVQAPVAICACELRR
jgi:hypothetical protein